MCRSSVTPGRVRRVAQLNALWNWANFWQDQAQHYSVVAEAVRRGQYSLVEEYHEHRDLLFAAHRELEAYLQQVGLSPIGEVQLSPIGLRCRTLRETVTRILEYIDHAERKTDEYWDLAESAQEKAENAFREWTYRRNFTLRARARGLQEENTDSDSDSSDE